MEMQLVLNTEVRTLSDENIRKIYGFQKDDDLHEAKQLILKTIHELELPSSFTLEDLHHCRKKVHANHSLGDNENGIKNDLFIKHLLNQLFPEIHQIPLPDMDLVSDIFKYPIGIATYSNTDVEFSFKGQRDECESLIRQFESKGLKIIRISAQKKEDLYTVNVKIERFNLDKFNKYIDQHQLVKNVQDKK